jgi:hypothetical protein
MPRLHLVAAATFSMVGALAFAARPANALPVEGFTGAFAVSNWLLNPLSSIVDVAGAPKSISISSPDDGSGDPGQSGFEITLPTQSYALSFAWNYATTDVNPSFDPFGYSVNGAFTPISDVIGANTQVGFTKLVLNPGDLFAFVMASDNTGGSATTIISEFGAGLPDEVSDCTTCYDFGDAPDSYHTTLAANGSQYEEGYLQRLGYNWDYEPNGQPTPDADGDDINLLGAFGPGEPPLVVDDEDGVTFGPTWVDVLFNIKRVDPHDYSMRAWWDLNWNGIFDHPSEMKITDVLTLSPGLYTKRYNLGFDPQRYYSRFRLTWIDDPSGVDGGVSLTTDIQPYGEYFSGSSFPGFGRSHGEVEDYAPVPAPLPLLGIGAAFRFTRRMRSLSQRIRDLQTLV